MPKFVAIDDFARICREGSPPGGVRSSGIVDREANSSGRLVSYILSDTSVGRDNHVIAANAWDLDNFMRNPVMPWAHDTDGPPIARWIEVETRGARLVGTAEYADRDTYAFADTIFRLVKGGFLNAVSTSWLPREWKFSSDRTRPGGIDFSRVELLECSQVPVPALPSALVTARKQGIDTQPLVAWAERLLDTNDFAVLPRSELETLRREAKMPTPSKRAKDDWKVGASRTLPIDEDSSWDGPAAEKSVFDHCGFDGDKPDTTLARKAFLAYDASAPAEKGSYKLPIAKIVDGRMTAVAAGIRAAASRLPDTDIPDDTKDSAGEVIKAYEGKMKKDQGAKLTHKRSLAHVGWLAYLLNELGYLQDCTEYEAAIEEDGSPVPGQLLAALKQLGEVLIAMTAEEVNELLSGDDEDDVVDDVYEMASSDGAIRRKAFRLFRKLDIGAMSAIAGAMHNHLHGRSVTFKVGEKVTAITRAGRVLSADNERCLREAHDHMNRAVDMVRSVVDQCDDDNQDDDNLDNPDDDNPDDDNQRAVRLRRAAALKLKLATTAA